MAAPTGTFTVKKWEEEPYREFDDGSKLTRATVTQSFHGEIEGEGSVEYLMAYREDGTADYVGLQYVEGTVGDRSGSFVLHLTGSFDGEAAKGIWYVAKGLGTGDLRDMRGEGEFQAPHGSEGSFTLYYDFGEVEQEKNRDSHGLRSAEGN